MTTGERTAERHRRPLELEYEHLFIGGRWVPARSGRRIESRDPATGAVWAELPEADEHDVARAVDAARSGFEAPAWRRMPGRERGRLLRRLAQLVEERAAELAELESRDNGKAIRETRGRELPAVGEELYYYAGFCDKITGDTISAESDWTAYTVREPVGVVGAIVPWNSPLFILMNKLAPVVASGNAIVIKPSEFTSVTALELAKLVEEAGFPPGVVNVVPGHGAPTGRALVGHDGVDRLTFTGEGRTARAITRESTGNLKRLSFELGGKAAHIVFADADYDQALAAVVEGAFIAAGQSCTAGAKVLVQRELFPRLVDDLARAAADLRVGDPLDPATEMGALTTLPQLEKTERHVKAARDAGASIVCGGERVTVPGLEGGSFFRPTVVADVTPDMEIYRDEVFGPVVTVSAFDTEAEAIEMANDTPYGLSAGFWTESLRRSQRVAAALRVGMVWVNTYRVVHWAVPFGGRKQSGYGREMGDEAIRMYTEPKSVLIDSRDSRTPWFARGAGQNGEVDR